MRECLLTGPASRLGKLMRAETIEQVKLFLTKDISQLLEFKRKYLVLNCN